MIWIFGSNYEFGGPQIYPGDMLATRNDVVVVTINYRLSLLGFLSAKGGRLLGNFGLWDQQLAIQWVKDNIEDYGGDPDSITLFGQSSGATSITYHMVSPSTPDGLFHRAITQSASAFSARLLSVDFHLPFYKRLLVESECEAADDSFACLQSLPLLTLFQLARGVQFYPAIDNEFISRTFYRQLANRIADNYSPQRKRDFGRFSSYDILSGWNTLEGMFYDYVLNGINMELENKNLSAGVSAHVLQSTLATLTRASTPEEIQFVDLAIHYYMNNPRSMISDGLPVEYRRIEAFVNIMSKHFS